MFGFGTTVRPNNIFPPSELNWARFLLLVGNDVDWYPMRGCYPDYIYRYSDILDYQGIVTGDFGSNVGEGK